MFQSALNLVNGVPILGHAKSIIHFATGDIEEGNKALYESSRSTLVLGGGVIGAIGGPAGAIAGATGAGLVTDAMCSIVTQEPHGVIDGFRDVGNDLKRGKLPVGSVLKTGILAASDAACGLGAGGISVGIKSAAKTATKKIIVTEISSNTLLATGMYSRCVFGARSGNEPRQFRSSSGNNSSSSNSNNKASESKSTKSTETKPKKDNNKNSSSNGSNGSGSDPPKDNKNNKNQHTTTELEPPELTLLRSMFKMVALNKIPLGKLAKHIFENLTPKQIESLVSLIKELQNTGYFEVIIQTIEFVCQNIDPDEVTFPNFLSLAEFVSVYVCELMGDVYSWFRGSGQIKKANSYSDRKQEVAEELFKHCCNNIVKVIKSLQKQIEKYSFSRYFRDIYSALYHYYKHRLVPKTLQEIEVEQYFKLVESLMKRVESLPQYKQLTNPRHPRTRLIFDRYYSNVSRRARIVIKCYDGKIIICSCFIRDKYNKNDKDGDEEVVE